MRKTKKAFAVFLVIGVVLAFVGGLYAQEAVKININKATVEELAQLKRVGEKYAERIVEYREKHGPFERVEDITLVPGIGPKTLEANKDVLSVE